MSNDKNLKVIRDWIVDVRRTILFSEYTENDSTKIEDKLYKLEKLESKMIRECIGR